MDVGLRRDISTICNDAGVARSTFYRWLKNEPAFRAAWESLWKETISRHFPTVISAQVHRAQTGDVSAARLLSELAQLIKQQVQVSGDKSNPIVVDASTRMIAAQELNEWRQQQAEALSTLSAAATRPISSTPAA